MLRLDNFETEIDGEILKRGKQYFKSGYVVRLEPDEDGWTAIVSGSEDYEVIVEAAGSGELLLECDCPYDYGPICKHEVAVLYAIQAQAEKPVKPSVNIGQVVEGLAREDLIAIVLQQIKKDKTLGNTILLRYSKNAPSKAVYCQTINDLMRAARGRDGYLDYSAGRRAAKGVYDLLNEARRWIDQRQAAKALPILQAVIETMPEAVADADDSHGELSGTLESAFDALDDLVEILDAEGKIALFRYCLDESFQGRYGYLDNDWDFLWLAGGLVVSQAEREALFAALDRKVAALDKTHFASYRAETAVEIKMNVMQRQGDNAAAIQELLKANIHLDRIRQQLIQQYIDEGKLNTAQKWCMEGIKQAESQRLPGLVTQYRAYLLQIAELEGDTEIAVDISRDQFLQTHDFAYYDKLKHLIPASKWADYLNKLLKKIEALPAWGGPNRMLAAIYAREAMWGDVLKLAERHGMSIVEAYKDELHTRYPETIAIIYEETVFRMLADTTNRDTYQQACNLLQRIRLLGRMERANEIVSELKTMYPRRKALMEELNRF